MGGGSAKVLVFVWRGASVSLDWPGSTRYIRDRQVDRDRPVGHPCSITCILMISELGYLAYVLPFHRWPTKNGKKDQLLLSTPGMGSWAMQVSLVPVYPTTVEEVLHSASGSPTLYCRGLK